MFENNKNYILNNISCLKDFLKTNNSNLEMLKEKIKTLHEKIEKEDKLNAQKSIICEKDLHNLAF